MVATTAVPLHRLFDGLIPPELITAYDHLLATGGCAKDTAPAELGGPAIVAASPTPAWPTSLRTPRSTRRGSAPPPRTWPSSACWPPTRLNSPATTNASCKAT